MDYRDNPQHFAGHHIKWTNITPPLTMRLICLVVIWYRQLINADYVFS